MRTRVAVLIVIVMALAGCATITKIMTTPGVVKWVSKTATYAAAKQFDISKGTAQNIIKHLGIVKEALPVALPPNFALARTKVQESDLDDIEMLILMTVVDIAEEQGAEYLKDKEIPVFTASGEPVDPVDKEKVADIKEYRKIMVAVIKGAEEGLAMIK